MQLLIREGYRERGWKQGRNKSSGGYKYGDKDMSLQEWPQFHDTSSHMKLTYKMCHMFSLTEQCMQYNLWRNVCEGFLKRNKWETGIPKKIKNSLPVSAVYANKNNLKIPVSANKKLFQDTVSANKK